MTVHLPVPFWPAVSRILSTSGWPSVVLEAENIAGDLDEIAVQLAPVPFGEHLVHLVGGHAQPLFHEVIGFADQLHVAILDAVVDHLDVMARAVLAHPVATRFAVLDLRRHRLEDRLDMRPRRRRSARHDRRTAPRPLLAAGDAGADVKQTL